MAGAIANWVVRSAAVALAAVFALTGTAQANADSATRPLVEFVQPLPDAPGQFSACSLRHAICLHAPSHVASSMALATLVSSERAWDVLTGALALPPPQVDLDGAWHAYLVDADVRAEDPGGGGRALLRERDPRAHFDSATSFGLIDAATPLGCPLDVAAARAVAHACLWRSAPATDEGSARAQVEALVRLAVPCAVSEVDLQEFQSHPERTLVDASSAPFDRGAALFYDWLDARFAREPGGLIRGLWALAPTRTPASASRWSTTPTGFDVLRESLKGAFSSDSTLDDVFVGFSLRRAQMVPSARLAWHVPWPLPARRLASPETVSPTGASYVLVDHAGATPGAKLRVEAQWEDFGRMRWVVVKLDAAGQSVAVMPVTSLARGTHASLTVESLEGVDRILVVGVNVGSTEHAFDPDQGEWEPHGWLLTLAAE